MGQSSHSQSSERADRIWMVAASATYAIRQLSHKKKNYPNFNIYQTLLFTEYCVVIYCLIINCQVIRRFNPDFHTVNDPNHLLILQRYIYVLLIYNPHYTEKKIIAAPALI